MDPKYKSLLLLLTTLLIGIIIGMLVSGYMFKQRIRDIRVRMDEKGSYLERLEDKADLSTEKWELVRPIIEGHFERMRDIRLSMREEMRMERDSLQNALREQLTEEEMEHVIHQMMGMFPRRHGKGPGKGMRKPMPPPF